MAPPAPATTAPAGRALWACLHAYADTYPGVADASHQRRARMWLRLWAAAVPSDGCNCKGGWAEILLLAPPPLEGRDSFSRWAITVHDAINAKLGKPLRHPQITLANPAWPILAGRWPEVRSEK